MDIAWGITSAIANPDWKIKLGQNGRKRVLENFSWDVAAQRTIQLYSELIKSKKSS